MTPEHLWLAVVALILLAVLGVLPIIRKAVFAFTLALGVGLVLYAIDNPEDALPKLAVLGAGVGLAGPARRLMLGRFL